MLTEQIGSGDDYDKINQVITIVIADYILVPESESYRHDFNYSDLKTRVTLTDISEIHTLELPKLPPSDDGTALWDWLKFLSSKSKEDVDMIAEKNPQVKKAAVRLMEISADKKSWMLYEARLKEQRDNRAREKYVAKEADKTARTDERFTIAKNLLRLNLPIDQIITVTGLTHDEVVSLQSSI